MSIGLKSTYHIYSSCGMIREAKKHINIAEVQIDASFFLSMSQTIVEEQLRKVHWRPAQAVDGAGEGVVGRGRRGHGPFILLHPAFDGTFFNRVNKTWLRYPYKGND